MPRFSIIVPAYKVQAYLGQCIDSVLSQSYEDFELIGVDDRSPDGCGQIFDEAAARDDRVRVLHLPENVGLGRARNAGLEVATGDYLLFLDSDDTLTPGALRAVADRLEECAEPEILVYDYARSYWNHKVRRSRDAELFSRPGPEVFSVGERPELLGLLMVVWNKAYRRDFVEQQGLRFPPGYYEDTPWTYPSMLAAERIALLDRVCVHYRQRRQGNILSTSSRKHFDVFDQYDRVFAFLDSRPDLGHWRPVVYGRMLHHLHTVVSRPDRVPADARREYFRRAARHCRRHRPAGYRPAVGPESARLRLLARGRRRSYAVLRALEWLRREAPGAVRRMRHAVGRPLLGAYQRIAQRLPVRRDLAVFAAYWNRGPSCNPAAIHAKLRELAPHIETVWVVDRRRRDEVPPGIPFVHPGSRRHRAAMARARYFVNNVNFPDSTVKRPGTVHLQTHHGTPVKYMGLDLQEHPAARMDFERLLERVDRWDYSLSSNRFSTLAWEGAYPAGYTTLEYGYPRNDVFYTATAQDVLEARAELGIPEGAVALLYAPTHRDYRSSYRPRLDLARLMQALGPGHVLLTRMHYFHDRQDQTPSQIPDGAVIDVSGHPSVERLCLASDGLITDYSSLMFDYANLDRPIVVYADDWEVYREARGVYLDVLSGRPGETPGAVARDEQELISVLTSGAWRDESAAGLRAAFRERFCEFDDGRAAERVVRRVFLGETTPLPHLPWAERRPAPDPVTALTQRGTVPAPAQGADRDGLDRLRAFSPS
ncbi:bifunctional glycosyltransferase/CDP-glycerol:glycerophosphate glycerophosphotransferase [Peterkaempfera bronchialis]|uniref:bifunctional glycosyltransferase/CDP-glycerol:glycerophosphate glycerophosphotransferase n=1 Tax=Peterkaempfera bronchialis TaxID=2126346 RepID=UPI003C2EC1A2